MNTDEALQARQRTEARRFAMASKRVERIADTGMWQHQPVDIRTLGTAVEELEAEIDRLQGALKGLDEARAFYQKIASRALEIKGEEIDRLNTRIGDLVAETWGLQNDNEGMSRQIDSLEHRLGNQAQTIRVMSETIRRLQEEEK